MPNDSAPGCLALKRKGLLWRERAKFAGRLPGLKLRGKLTSGAIEHHGSRLGQGKTVTRHQHTPSRARPRYDKFTSRKTLTRCRRFSMIERGSIPSGENIRSEISKIATCTNVFRELWTGRRRARTPYLESRTEGSSLRAVHHQGCPKSNSLFCLARDSRR